MIDALEGNEQLPPIGPGGRIADAEGTMEHAPLVYALVHALDRAITGDIVFRTVGGAVHSVTFFEGAPVRVESSAGAIEGDWIGEDLVAMEHLREDALAEALVTAQSSRRRLGELLVQAGAIEPSALTHTLTLQTARRLALLANLPPETSFSLYFSARAEPEPHAPWAPIDTLLATVRAWTDRSRLHGTLRWLAGKKLTLVPDSTIAGVMLTSRERDAVSMMQKDAPSLKTLYAAVGKGLSSLLYVLAVTRQFTFTAAKGAPMGRRKESDLVRDIVQIAVPIAPVIAPAEPSADDLEERPEKLSVPPPPEEVAAAPRARVSVAAGPLVDGPMLAPVRVAAPPASVPPPPVAAASPPAAAARSVVPRPPPAATAPPAYVARPTPAPMPAASRPSASPPKFVDPGKPQSRIVDTGTHFAAEMSDEFRRAEEAAKRQDYDTADRILRERCTEQDAAEADFQALTAWVKANLNAGDLSSGLNDLTFLLMSHNQLESALYYRGLLLKRSGKEKAALRDFVILAKKNPNHMGALAEIKLLREATGKK